MLLRPARKMDAALNAFAAISSIELTSCHDRRIVALKEIGSFKEGTIDTESQARRLSHCDADGVERSLLTAR